MFLGCFPGQYRCTFTWCTEIYSWDTDKTKYMHAKPYRFQLLQRLLRGMNRVLHCFQALGMIKCIPLTWSIGQRSVREGWNRAKRQAWSHQLWFPKKGKRSLHVSVSFGHSLLVTTRASSSVCVAHSRKLKIRRRRRQKGQERCRKGVGCKCSTLFCLFLWRHCKAATW